MPADRRVWAEAAILIAATPLLLFPTQLPALSAAAAGALPAVWLWQARATPRRPFWPASPLNLPLLLLAVAVALGVVVSADPDLAWPKAAGIWLGLVWTRWLLQAIRTRADVARYTAGVLVAGVAVCLLGAATADWMAKAPGLRALVAALPDRLIALPEAPPTGTHTNQLGGALLLVAPLLLSLAISPGLFGRVGRARAALVPAAVVCLALLILTQSRSAWVGLLAAGAVLAAGRLAQPTRPAERRAAIALTAVGVVLLAVATVRLDLPAVIASWDGLPDETGIGTLRTLDFRREVWRWGATAAADAPLTGVGLGSFRRAGPRLYPIAVPVTFDIAHAHNIFLQTALDLGIGGLVAYTSVLLISVGLCVGTARRAPADRPLVHGLLAAQIALHVYGLTDALSLGSKPAIIWWLLVGLGAGVYRVAAQTDGRQTAEQLSGSV